MEYIAHKNGERVQTVKEHLYGTAELAGSFAEKFGKKEWGYCCGILHDLGKYSKEFLRKIQNDTSERVDHSTAGAKVCNEKGGYYSILSYCIAGHHAGLPDYGNTAIGNSLCGRCNKKICDFENYKNEIQIPKLHTDPIVFDPTKNLDFSKGIHETTEYLEVFLRNLLLNEKNELLNRHLHISRHSKPKSGHSRSKSGHSKPKSGYSRSKSGHSSLKSECRKHIFRQMQQFYSKNNS